MLNFKHEDMEVIWFSYLPLTVESLELVAKCAACYKTNFDLAVLKLKVESQKQPQQKKAEQTLFKR